MPNNFQLLDKDTKDAVSLTKVDEDLAELLDKPVDPTFYVAGWFDSIGFQIAMGKSLGSDELREKIKNYPNPDDLIKCLDYLEERYISKAWVD